MSEKDGVAAIARAKYVKYVKKHTTTEYAGTSRAHSLHSSQYVIKHRYGQLSSPRWIPFDSEP